MFSLILLLMSMEFFVQINSQCEHKKLMMPQSNSRYSYSYSNQQNYYIANSTCSININIYNPEDDITIHDFPTDIKDDSYVANRTMYLRLENNTIPTFKTTLFMTPLIACYYGKIHLFVEDSNVQEIPYNGFLHKVRHNINYLEKCNVNYVSITFHNNNISTIHSKTFNGSETLTRIDLENNYINNLEEYAFDNLPKLETLLLSKNNISTLSNAFGMLNNIKILNVSHNKIDLQSSKLFDNLTSLTNLDLSYNTIDHLLPKIFNKLTSLNHLKISNNRIDQLLPKIFENLTSLFHLNISNNKIEEILPNTFIYLQQLNSLDLSKNRLTTINIGAFSGLHNLKKLLLNGNRLVDIKYLLVSTPELGYVDISNNEIEYADVDVFSGHLFWININGNKFSCLELIKLRNYFYRQHITMQNGLERERLNLYGNHCNHTEEDNMQATASNLGNTSNAFLEFLNRGFKRTNFYNFFNNFTNNKIQDNIASQTTNQNEMEVFNRILNASEEIIKEIQIQKQVKQNFTDNNSLILLQILKEIKDLKQFKYDNVEKLGKSYNENVENSKLLEVLNDFNDAVRQFDNNTVKLDEFISEKYIQTKEPIAENHESGTSNLLLVIVFFNAVITVAILLNYYGKRFILWRRRNTFNTEDAISRTELSAINCTL